MSEWINCSDRMPENGQVVKALGRKGYYYLAEYNSQSGKFVSGICNCKNVTHWMPLTEISKESS